MLRLSAAAAIAAALALAGCKSECLQLAQQICGCQATSTARDTCNQQVSNTESQVSETGTDNAHCAELLSSNQCDCHNLDTAQGQINCGLARDPSWSATVPDAG